MAAFPPSPYESIYEQDKAERKLVQKWIERDAEEGMAQYTRIIASMFGLKTFEDWAPSERLYVYMVNPPITPEGAPPPDQGPVVEMVPSIDPATQQQMIDEMGQPSMEEQVVSPAVYPQWTALAAEFPEYWTRCCEDYYDLYSQFLEGGLVPREMKA